MTAQTPEARIADYARAKPASGCSEGGLWRSRPSASRRSSTRPNPIAPRCWRETGGEPSQSFSRPLPVLATATRASADFALASGRRNLRRPINRHANQRGGGDDLGRRSPPRMPGPSSNLASAVSAAKTSSSLGIIKPRPSRGLPVTNSGHVVLIYRKGSDQNESFQCGIGEGRLADMTRRGKAQRGQAALRTLSPAPDP